MRRHMSELHACTHVCTYHDCKCSCTRARGRVIPHLLSIRTHARHHAAHGWPCLTKHFSMGARPHFYTLLHTSMRVTKLMSAHHVYRHAHTHLPRCPHTCLHTCPSAGDGAKPNLPKPSRSTSQHTLLYGAWIKAKHTVAHVWADALDKLCSGLPTTVVL